MRHLTATVDGKLIGYHDETEFLIQIGKGKSSYKTVMRLKNLGNAVLRFNSLNVHSGYKKRLFVPSFNKPVLCRVIT